MQKFLRLQKASRSFQKTYFASVLAGVLLFSLSPCTKAAAQGDLMIMPKRVVFEGAQRSQELNLSNTGQDTARYIISLVHYRMKEDGSFEEMAATDTSTYFADKFVRFFPRSVTLGPKESQTVRIQLMNTGKLLPGEYRSHIYFRALLEEKPLGEKEIKKTDSTAISIRLKPVFGIAIPVIIHVGESTAQASLSKCSFELFDGTTPLVKMTLNRTGNMSVYGDVTIEYISPDGKVTKVGSVQGLGLYTPNASRNIKIALKKDAGVDYSRGKLHILYQAQENANQYNTAQAEVYLN